MINESFYRFVRLFWLCDLAWKSSLLLNKICSIDLIFFMTFQFQASKIGFCFRFEPFYSFSISSSPIFMGWFLAKLISKSLWTSAKQHQIILFGKPLCTFIRFSRVHLSNVFKSKCLGIPKVAELRWSDCWNYHRIDPLFYQVGSQDGTTYCIILCCNAVAVSSRVVSARELRQRRSLEMHRRKNSAPCTLI